MAKMVKQRDKEKEHLRKIFKENSIDVKMEMRTRVNHSYRAIELEEQLRRRKKYSIGDKDAAKTYMQAAKHWLLSEDSNRFLYAVHDLERGRKLASGKEKYNFQRTIDDIYLKSPSLKEKGGLEKRTLLAVASIISLLGALLSVSFNLTGYAIGALSYEKISLAGSIFFVLGLVFTFLFLRRKNR